MRSPSPTKKSSLKSRNKDLRLIIGGLLLTVSVGLNLINMRGTANVIAVQPNLLEDYLHNFISSGTSSHSERIPPWKRRSTTIPQWMADYFEWHAKEQTRIETQEQLNTTDKFAVITCLDRDEKCGGASDRLHVLPWAIMMAARSNRILLLRWERPCALEEFLVPNHVRWSVPDWLWSELDKKGIAVIANGGDRALNDIQGRLKDRQTVYLRQQSNDHGSVIYNKMCCSNITDTTKDGFYPVFADVWESFFRPSLPVQKLLDENMQNLQLQPGQYIAAHVRQKYTRDKSMDTTAVENAVRCAYSRRSEIPIYFASDSLESTRHALEYGKQSTTANRTVRVVGRVDEGDEEPLHLDRGREFLKVTDAWKEHAPSEYYNVFVDLYLLGQSKCVVYGKGGYGQWASALTSERCSFRHTRKQCTWEDRNITKR